MTSLVSIDCEAGYSVELLKTLLPPAVFAQLSESMYGSTMAICNGEKYNHERKEYELSCNGVSHGIVMYAHDVLYYLGKEYTKKYLTTSKIK